MYVVVLLMSQHFRKAAEYMGDQAELQEHGTHLAIACNHLKVRPCWFLVTRKLFGNFCANHINVKSALGALIYSCQCHT